MNLFFLPFGYPGVFAAAALSLFGGLICYVLAHLFGKNKQWSHAHEIAWGWLTAMLITASADIWHLLYIGITPMQSPVTIARVLARIHDPDHLGIRVIGEFAGASFGVLLGWWLLLLKTSRLASSGDEKHEQENANHHE